MPPNRGYATIRVSVDLHSMIKDIESTCMELAQADSEAETAALYTQLCYYRKFLYEYLSDLEEDGGVLEEVPTTHLRFL